jgi:hypothetical protein
MSVPPPVVPVGYSQTSGLAVASLVLGVLFMFTITAVLAVIFGHVALRKIKRSDGALTGRGLAIAGLTLGYFWIAIIVIAIASTAFGESSVEGDGEFGIPQVSGQLPLAPPDVVVDGSVAGEVVPTVLGEDFDGGEVRIENDGRAKAIVFLAHWASYSQAEVVTVQEWLDSRGGVRGVDMYSVSTAMDSTSGNYPASEWLEREGWTVPVVVDDEKDTALDAFGGDAFPYWVFVNSDGTVAVRVTGFMPIAVLEEIMRSLE